MAAESAREQHAILEALRAGFVLTGEQAVRWVGAQKMAEQGAETWDAATLGVIGSVEALAIETAETNIELAALAAAELAASTTSLGLNDDIGGLESAFFDATYETERNTEAVRLNANEQSSLTMKLQGARTTLLNATDALTDSNDALTGSFEEGTRQGRDNIAQVHSFADGLFTLESQMLTAGDSAGLARARTLEMAQGYLTAADAAGKNTDEIQDLLIELGLMVEGQWVPTIGLAGINEFLSTLGTAQGALAGLTDKTVTVRFNSDSRGFQIPTAAIGQPNFPLRTGGPVPGAKDAPSPIMAHGGEFVLSADVVQQIKRGGPTLGLGRPTGVESAPEQESGNERRFAGGAVTINVQQLDPQVASREIAWTLEHLGQGLS